MEFNDNKTSVMKLVDLLETHKLLMEKCPEVIEIIENLYLDIEKQQIIEAYRDGRSDQFSKVARFYNRNAGSYYNEKYQNEDSIKD